MADSKMLINLMKNRYGETLVKDILSKCEFTDNENENLAMVFRLSIKTLDEFTDIRRATLKFLQLLDPNNKLVLAMDNQYMTLSDLDDISSEVGAMRKILKDLGD